MPSKSKSKSKSNKNETALVLYKGGVQKGIARSLARTDRNAAQKYLENVYGRKAQPGVGVKRKSSSSPKKNNSNEESQYSNYLGPAVIGGAKGTVYGYVNEYTGMVWDPVSKTWVKIPSRPLTNRTYNALKTTAQSVFKPSKKAKVNNAYSARSIQSALSYDPKVGKQIGSLQKKIKELENVVKVAMNNDDPALASRKRKEIDKLMDKIVELVSAESNRLNKVYKNLGINFNKTPAKNVLRTNPGVLSQTLSRIFGTKPNVSLSNFIQYFPSPAAFAAVTARRGLGTTPNYGGMRGTGSATAARATMNRRGTPIPLPFTMG